MSGLRALFETARLAVRPATDCDAPFVTSLWRNPLVMRHVGFPNGIPTAITDVPPRIQRGRGLDQLLIAEETETGRPIGQCLLGEPDADAVSEPDIKLVPEHWGRGYGRELWAALIDQLFLRSSCRVVRGTPSIANLASIRMQESAEYAKSVRSCRRFHLNCRNSPFLPSTSSTKSHARSGRIAEPAREPGAAEARHTGDLP